jgi:hypothetical protein
VKSSVVKILRQLARHGYKHGAVNHAREEWISGVHHVQGIKRLWSFTVNKWVLVAQGTLN